MTTETQLRNVLEAAGAALPNAAGRFDDVVRRGRRRRGGRRVGVAGAIVAGAVVVAGLSVPRVSPTVAPVLGTGASGEVQVAIFLCDDRSPANGAPCTGPVTEEELAGLRISLDQDGQVTDYRYESKDEALIRFSELMADQPELVEAVTADVLPASFQVAVADEVDPQALVARYRAMPGVEEAVVQELE